jgi:hypothetical protein
MLQKSGEIALYCSGPSWITTRSEVITNGPASIGARGWAVCDYFHLCLPPLTIYRDTGKILPYIEQTVKNTAPKVTLCHNEQWMTAVGSTLQCLPSSRPFEQQDITYPHHSNSPSDGNVGITSSSCFATAWMVGVPSERFQCGDTQLSHQWFFVLMVK